MKAVPSIIIWELWKRRNNLKHGGTISFNILVYQVNANIWQLAKFKFPKVRNRPTQWPNIVEVLASFKTIVHYKMVQWHPPPIGTIKFNTDGANIIHDTTNTEAEAIAIREAIAYGIAEGYARCIIERDSLLLKKILEGEWKTPWQINTIIEDIKEFMNYCDTEVHHIYREGNKLADYMANLALDWNGKQKFRGFKELTGEGKCIVNMDKALVPNFIFNTRKIQTDRTW
ncbi:hypothetical protein RDI58_007373 [Solanum bulbocastanum]|uniref:RNase H type-1 domain-containing protein n=1 Tax=Solanum bulbocastanum TaxID=147425 RepID=A0AAN8TUY9_SOLBU